MASFHMKSVGQGEPVVLIPGLGGLARFWSPVTERLCATFHVSACDHPGMGESKEMGAPSITEIVSAIVHWMDAKGIEQIHAVGHSTGALVAQALALDHEPRVKSIVLSSGWARPDQRFRDLFKLRKHVLENLGGTAYTALGQIIAYPSKWYGAHFASKGDIDFAAASSINVDLTCARIDMLLSYSRINELNEIAVPTLVIGAEDDYIVPFHHSEELVELIPGATLFKLSGGHFTPVTRTADYTERLVEFWKLNK